MEEESYPSRLEEFALNTVGNNFFHFVKLETKRKTFNNIKDQCNMIGFIEFTYILDGTYLAKLQTGIIRSSLQLSLTIIRFRNLVKNILKVLCVILISYIII